MPVIHLTNHHIQTVILFTTTLDNPIHTKTLGTNATQQRTHPFLCLANVSSHLAEPKPLASLIHVVDCIKQHGLTNERNVN
jgi:hypothetical protein